MAGHADKQFLSRCDFGAEIADLDFVGILGFDTDYKYRIYSPVVERITGIKASEALGECAFDVFPFLKSTGAESYYHDVLADARRGIKFGLPYYVESTGREGLLDFSYRPVPGNSQGDVIGGLFEIRDMRKVFEDHWGDGSSKAVFLPDAQRVMTNIGSAIKARRKTLGLSQEELAHRCGMHRTYITDIERGARNIAFKNIVQLAKALEQPVWALVGVAGTGCVETRSA